MKSCVAMSLLGTVISMSCAADVVEARVDLTVGQTWSVTLPGNPTTGYMWSVAENSGLVQVELAPEKKESPCRRPMVGSPCGTVVSLTAPVAGQGSVKLIYARPWEKGKAPAETRIFIVTVK